MNRKLISMFFFILIIAAAFYLKRDDLLSLFMHSTSTGSRIACVGDSLTYGSSLDDPAVESYPAYLQLILGDNYTVGNFGEPSAAVQHDSDHPYQNSASFEGSIAFEPDIVLIMIGSNDTKSQNWKGIEPFMRDYFELVSTYRSLPKTPAIVVLTPPCVFSLNNEPIRHGINQTHVDEIAAELNQQGAAGSFDVVDIHGVTVDHPEYFPDDGVHTNLDGNSVIAQNIANFIQTNY